MAAAPVPEPTDPRVPLAGRVALISGASRGLGRALALRYSEAGATVVLCARSTRSLEDVARGIRAGGGTADAFSLDVTDADAVEAMLREVRARHGRLDVLVNNASLLGSRGPLAAQDPVEWRAVLDVNITGAFLLTRAALPLLRDSGGAVVNVSSGVGNRDRRDWGAYAVSKRALEAFSGNLALEEQAHGVRVNVVDPGRMRTGMRAAAYPEEDPATLPEPRDVTDVFVWLASGASGGVTGQRFVAQDWSPDRT